MTFIDTTPQVGYDSHCSVASGIRHLFSVKAAMSSSRFIAFLPADINLHPLTLQTPKETKHQRSCNGAHTMKEIRLTKGAVAIVDDDDYEWLSKNKWYRAGRGYAGRTTKEVHNVLMHREIMMRHSPPPNDGNQYEVDHINRNKLDNRKENLRWVTHRQNMHNTDSHESSTSLYKGVFWFARARKWVASIRSNGKQKYLGTFDSPHVAAYYYNQAAKELHGEFAVLNPVSPVVAFMIELLHLGKNGYVNPLDLPYYKRMIKLIEDEVRSTQPELAVDTIEVSLSVRKHTAYSRYRSRKVVVPVSFAPQMCPCGEDYAMTGYRVCRECHEARLAAPVLFEGFPPDELAA
jgi:hypothetical protein